MLAESVTFQVFGVPAPQGSKRHVGNGVMVESSKKVGPWREAVITAARASYDGLPLDGALALALTFVMPRPKSARKGAHWKTSAPDLSKLIRATEDALVIAGVIRDDARIAHLLALKRFADLDDPWSGAYIAITALPERLKNDEPVRPYVLRSRHSRT